MAPLIGFKHSKETRKQMSESHKGKSSGMKGKHHSQVTKEKLRKASTGFKHNQKTKDKISKANKGKIISEKQKKQISQALKGIKRKPFKEETKRKISYFQQNFWSKRQTSVSSKREQVMINGKLKRVSHIVWEMENGEIPSGFFIHHKDLNPENNDIRNLLLIKSGDHTKLHRGLMKNG